MTPMPQARLDEILRKWTTFTDSNRPVSYDDGWCIQQLEVIALIREIERLRNGQ